MRALDVIDSELRLISAVRACVMEHGAPPTIGPADALLDERHEVQQKNAGPHRVRAELLIN